MSKQLCETCHGLGCLSCGGNGMVDYGSEEGPHVDDYLHVLAPPDRHTISLLNTSGVGIIAKDFGEGRWIVENLFLTDQSCREHVFFGPDNPSAIDLLRFHRSMGAPGHIKQGDCVFNADTGTGKGVAYTVSGDGLAYGWDSPQCLCQGWIEGIWRVVDGLHSVNCQSCGHRLVWNNPIVPCECPECGGSVDDWRIESTTFQPSCSKW